MPYNNSIPYIQAILCCLRMASQPTGGVQVMSVGIDEKNKSHTLGTSNGTPVQLKTGGGIITGKIDRQMVKATTVDTGHTSGTIGIDDVSIFIDGKGHITGTFTDGHEDETMEAELDTTDESISGTINGLKVDLKIDGNVISGIVG